MLCTCKPVFDKPLQYLLCLYQTEVTHQQGYNYKSTILLLGKHKLLGFLVAPSTSRTCDARLQLIVNADISLLLSMADRDCLLLKYIIMKTNERHVHAQTVRVL